MAVRSQLAKVSSRPQGGPPMKKICITLLAVTSILLAACGPVISIAPPRPRSSPEPTAENQFDFGDAPETYPVILSADGARIHDPYHFWLGSLESATSLETDAQIVDRDEADDGLENNVFSSNRLVLTIRLSRSQISPTGDVYLNGLIDSNFDGDWADPGERFINNQIVSLASGEEKSVQAVAPLITSETWIRLLVTEEPVLENWVGAGFWKLGEVEDYHVVVEPFDTPTPWTPWTPTDTPTATLTPTERVIYTTPGGNRDTPTPTDTPKWICTKCGGPTDTPTPTDPPPDCSDPANLRPECTQNTPPPPAEQPTWSGNICGGIDLFSEPGGALIRRVGAEEHVYFYETRADGWVRVRAGNDSGWIQPNWNDPNAFGYEGHSCQ